MPNENDFWHRLLFKVKLYETYGTSFQQLVNTLFGYSIVGFQAIDPWGNWGDGGNDGWVPSVGHYYQVYGPKPTSNTSPLTVLNKACKDFDKLTEKWSGLNGYMFVLNDRFCGAPAPLASALLGLKTKYSLEETGVICAADLESMFMGLDNDKKMQIVGGIPDNSNLEIDPTAVGTLLSHLADSPAVPPAFLSETAPDFDQKLTVNGLTEPVTSYLRTNYYHVDVVDEFLEVRDPGLKQDISNEVGRLYSDSKSAIPDSDGSAANLRYVWMVENLIPDSVKDHPHSLKAYRQAAQVILAKYFETCDAYEHPVNISSA